MARGPKKHLKRINAPKRWMLNKLGGTWAPRPSTGPHKLRECLPLILILRNKLKYALTRREVVMILMRRHIAVDGKIRTDPNFPCGFQDIITIEKTGEQFIVLLDPRGRFVLEKTEGKVNTKLLRVKKLSKGTKSKVGANPLIHGQAGAVPFIVTHDGRTIRYPHPDIRVGDVVKYNLETKEIEGFIKLQQGTLVTVSKGNNVGRMGTISRFESHPGSFNIVHVKDKTGHEFATRLENVFAVGGTDGKAWTQLPRGGGVRLSIQEAYDKQLAKRA